MDDAEWIARFAKRYVALVAALMKEGVQETKAREEARIVASLEHLTLQAQGAAICPLCGRGAIS